MMLISEKCQSAVCFLSSDGALEGEGTSGGLSLSHPAINSKVRITNLSLWPAATLSVLCARKGWPVRCHIRSSIKLWQTRLSNCNPFCNLSQTKRSNDAFGSTFLMCEIVFASICGLNRNGLHPPTAGFEATAPLRERTFNSNSCRRSSRRHYLDQICKSTHRTDPWRIKICCNSAGGWVRYDSY